MTLLEIIDDLDEVIIALELTDNNEEIENHIYKLKDINCALLDFYKNHRAALKKGLQDDLHWNTWQAHRFCIGHWKIPPWLSKWRNVDIGWWNFRPRVINIKYD